VDVLVGVYDDVDFVVVVFDCDEYVREFDDVVGLGEALLLFMIVVCSSW